MEYYDKISEGYDELHKAEQLKKIRVILNNVRFDKNEKILDVGCGPCYLNEMIKNEVVGVDPAFKLLRKSGNEEMVCGRAEKLPFKKNSFDVVVALTSIHNFDDIHDGINEMIRVGKEHFVLTVLKKSKKSGEIRKIISRKFRIVKRVDEGKDIVYVLEK